MRGDLDVATAQIGGSPSIPMWQEEQSVTLMRFDPSVNSTGPPDGRRPPASVSTRPTRLPGCSQEGLSMARAVGIDLGHDATR